MADLDDGEQGVCFDPNKAAAVLAEDLNKMTVEERNNVLYDVHGVRKFSPSLPSKVLESLEQMNAALDRIRHKTAYFEAVSLGSQYVLRDQLFRVRFLKADEFDPQKAAQRFVNYLDFAHELFGTLALMRPIYFDDLSKEEQNILREGTIQLLPYRDRTERRILTRIGPMGGPDECQYSPRVMRVNLYMMQVLSTDEQTQQYGCVMIFHTMHYPTEDSYDQEMGFLKKEANIGAKMRKFVNAFPVRVGALHLCFPRDLKYRLASAALSLIAPSILRVRVRTHLGSQLECRYALMSYGIPGDQLPITSSGRIKTVNHQRWIKFQREKEDTIQMGLPPFEGVDCPLGMDILIGNNSSYRKNAPGNCLYRELLHQYLGQYEDASDTQEKTRLTWTVLEKFTSEGGRILVRDRRGWWSVANTAKAREKIAHDFRETRKKNLAAAAANNSNHANGNGNHKMTTTTNGTANTTMNTTTTTNNNNDANPTKTKKRKSPVQPEPVESGTAFVAIEEQQQQQELQGEDCFLL